MPAFQKIPRELISKVPMYDYKTPLEEALAKLQDSRIAIVTKQGAYFGTVEYGNISGIGMFQVSKSYPLGKLARKVPYVTADTDIDETIKAMYENSAKALPFHNGKSVSGVIRRSDMLRAILSLKMVSKLSVRELMANPLISIPPEMQVSAARKIMEENKLNRLIVMDNGRLYGILTKNNISSHLLYANSRNPEYGNGKGVQRNSVGTICEKNVYTIGYQLPANEAIKKMINNKISSLVVTKGSDPVGILTITDVFRYLSESTDSSSPDIEISGLDRYTRDYYEFIEGEIGSLAAKADRFASVAVERVTINIKREKAKTYLFRASLELSGKGRISTSAEGYSIEQGIREISNKLYEIIKSTKERKKNASGKIRYGLDEE